MNPRFSRLMEGFVSNILVTGLICGVIVFAITGKKVSAAGDEEVALKADRALSAALANADRKAAESLLDREFTWTGANGKTRNKSEALADLTAFAADSQGDSDVSTHSFGEVERVVGEHHGDRFVRIWVKRPAGWRAFIDLDTPIPEKGYSNHPSPPRAKDKDCENPCKVLPYRPANAAQRSAMDTWLKLKIDEWHAIAKDWPAHVSENMVIISPGMYMTKEQRLALLERQHEAYGDGSPSAPVISMHMFDFGNVVIMTALHGANTGGRHSYAVRMFVNESGDWKIALSAQTDIKQPAGVDN